MERFIPVEVCGKKQFLSGITFFPLRGSLTRGEPRESWSAYHLYGKHGNSKENSNGTVHPGGKFSEKK